MQVEISVEVISGPVDPHGADALAAAENQLIAQATAWTSPVYSYATVDAAGRRLLVYTSDIVPR